MSVNLPKTINRFFYMIRKATVRSLVDKKST